MPPYGLKEHWLRNKIKRKSSLTFVRELLRLIWCYAYQPPKTESRKPAAMAEPMTPATLGPMACISR